MCKDSRNHDKLQIYLQNSSGLIFKIYQGFK
jgi:hypothetical protein